MKGTLKYQLMLQRLMMQLQRRMRDVESLPQRQHQRFPHFPQEPNRPWRHEEPCEVFLYYCDDGMKEGTVWGCCWVLQRVRLRVLQMEVKLLQSRTPCPAFSFCGPGWVYVTQRRLIPIHHRHHRHHLRLLGQLLHHHHLHLRVVSTV